MYECKLKNGLRLRYRDQGSGPVVLMLHGWTSGSWFFESLMNHLCGQYRCLALDFKGHGESDKPLDSAYTMQALTHETLEFIELLHLKDLVLVGHSMGGGIVQHLIVEHGAELSVRGLVMLSTSAGRETVRKGLRLVIQAMRKNVLKYGTHISPVMAQRMAALGFDQEFAEKYPERIEFVNQEAEKMPATVRVDLFEDICQDFCSEDSLHKINVPCLCICGTRDRLYEDTLYLAKHIPSARFVPLEGAGHMINWEEADKVNTCVADFLGEIY